MKEKWEKIDLYYSADSILSFSNYNVIPMDLEISSDNKIFASTTHDAIFGVNSLSSLGGGRITGLTMLEIALR